MWRRQVPWAITLLWMCLGTGCVCDNVVFKDPSGSQKADAGENIKIDPAQKTDSKRTQYTIRGVSTVTFYPEDNQALEGALGGYIMWYSKPQTTTLQFLDMADNTCEFTRIEQTNEPRDFYGLDSGASLLLALGTHQLELERAPLDPNDANSGSYYGIPPVEKMKYPYNQPLTITGKGGDGLGAFTLQLRTPPQLVVEVPKVKRAGTPLTLTKDIPLKWRFDGEVPYLSVRINQFDPATKQTLSLSCRFANTGEATIPVKELKPFAADAAGKYTHIFFFSGKYQFPKIKDFEEPLLAVVEAITTSPVMFE